MIDSFPELPLSLKNCGKRRELLVLLLDLSLLKPHEPNIIQWPSDIRLLGLRCPENPPPRLAGIPEPQQNFSV